MPRQQLQFHEFFQIIEFDEKIVKIHWLRTKVVSTIAISRIFSDHRI